MWEKKFIVAKFVVWKLKKINVLAFSVYILLSNKRHSVEGPHRNKPHSLTSVCPLISATSLNAAPIKDVTIFCHYVHQEAYGTSIQTGRWWIVFVVWLTDERRLALFPAGTIVRDPRHRKSLTRREQDLDLHRTWVQTLLNEVLQQW